jgi:hypothetical protein
MAFGYIFTGLFALAISAKAYMMVKDSIEDDLIDRLFDACRKRLLRQKKKS